MDIDKKLDKISDTLSGQAVTLERLTVTVEQHTKRSDMLEAIVLPLQRKANYIEGALKLVGFLATCAAIYEAISWSIHR